MSEKFLESINTPYGKIECYFNGLEAYPAFEKISKAFYNIQEEYILAEQIINYIFADKTKNQEAYIYTVYDEIKETYDYENFEVTVKL